MSHSIILRDHKVFVKRHVIRDEYQETETDTLADYLQCAVDIEGDFTFGDLWKLIVKDGSFYERVFKRAMGGYPLAPFEKDAKALLEPDDEPMYYLELYHYGEVWDYTEYKKHADWGRQLEIYHGFHGIGPQKDPLDDTKTIIGSWSLSFTPLAQIIDLPIKLDKSIKLTIHERKGKKSFNTSHFDGGTMEFTVYDVLETVLDEVTWHGTPEERSGRLSELDQRYEAVKDGAAETRPIDELLDELDPDDEATDGN